MDWHSQRLQFSYDTHVLKFSNRLKKTVVFQLIHTTICDRRRGVGGYIRERADKGRRILDEARSVRQQRFCWRTPRTGSAAS